MRATTYACFDGAFQMKKFLLYAIFSFAMWPASTHAIVPERYQYEGCTVRPDGTSHFYYSDFFHPVTGQLMSGEMDFNSCDVFADKVVEFHPGVFTVTQTAEEAAAALGSPDQKYMTEATTQGWLEEFWTSHLFQGRQYGVPPAYRHTHASLGGHGGWLVVEFTDNVIVTNPSNKFDLCVIEEGFPGKRFDAYEVDISADGKTWATVINSSTEGVQCAKVATALSQLNTWYARFVKIIDHSNDWSGGVDGDTLHSGADIDSVVAFSSLPISEDLITSFCSDTPAPQECTPVEVIKEVEVVKEVQVPVEVIKEVPVEVIKEVPVEVVKEVQVPVEVVKEVQCRVDYYDEESKLLHRIELLKKHQSKTTCDRNKERFSEKLAKLQSMLDRFSAIPLCSDITANDQDEAQTVPAKNSLVVSSDCSNDPGKLRRWRIRNDNATPIEIDYEIMGSKESGVPVIPAAADYYLETATITGSNQIKLRYLKEGSENLYEVVKVSGTAKCGKGNQK